MSDEIMARKYEFFSKQGFIVGAVIISLSFVLQSLVSFPSIWQDQAFQYILFIAFSGFVVGVASGGVLVFLFPPDQDVIGLAGLGSDNATQHFSLVLVILALVQPFFTGFVLFYDYFAADVFVPIWVLLGFAAPSIGLTAAMFERTKAIAEDLRIYFAANRMLDMASLDWLHGLGPRTATYRMGMLERAAERVPGIRITGHQIVRVEDQLATNK
jgi:hypothetical protein